MVARNSFPLYTYLAYEPLLFGEKIYIPPSKEPVHRLLPNDLSLIQRSNRHPTPQHPLYNAREFVSEIS